MKTQRQKKTMSDSEQSSPPRKVRGSKAKSSISPDGQSPLVTFEHAPIGIVECSPDGKHLRANEEFSRLLGYEKDELVGKGIKSITHEDDYPIDIKLHQQLVEGKIPYYRFEKRYVRKDGEILWVELTRSVVRDAAGQPLYTVGVVLDISDRKHVERVLRDSSERLRLATEVAQMFTWELDFKTQVYTFADNFERVLGFSGGLLPKNSMDAVQKLSPAEDVQLILEEFRKAIESRDDLHALQYRMIDPESGQMVWLEANAKIVYDETGFPERMFGVTQNITERKKAQEEITIISRMPEENPNPVMRLTQDGSVIYANSPSVSLLKPAEGNAPRVISRKLKASVEATYASGVKQEVEIENGGKVFTVTLAPISGAGYVNFYGNDITERKQAEKALRESEERLRATFNTTVVGFATLTPQAQFIEVNDAFCHIVGYSRDELIQMNYAALTHPDNIASTNEHIAQLLAGQVSSFVLEKIYICKDGTQIWVQNSVSLARDIDGQPLHLIAICQDITERKRFEQKLAESARQQEALYQLTDQLQRTTSLEDVFESSLNAILAALQCDRASILLLDDQNVMSFVAWRGLSDDYRNATNGHSPWKPDTINPVPIRMNDVSMADLSDSLRTTIRREGIGALAFIPLVSNEKLIGKFMTYYNAPHVFSENEVELSLTIAHQLAFAVDRKRIERELERERALLQRLFETMPVMVSIYDAESRSMRLNGEFTRSLGWRSEDVSVLSLLEGLYPDPDYRAQVLQRMAAADGTNEWVEVQVQTREGRKLDSLWSNISISKDKQLITGIALGIDITERKRSEEKLRQAAAFDEAVMSNMGEGLYTVDSEGRVVSMNPAAEKMFGWTLDELRGRSMHDVTHYQHPDGTPFPAEECAGFQVLHHGHKLVGYEDIFIRKDGSFFNVVYSSAPLWENGKISGLVIVFSDNTVRKQSERRLILLSAISDLVRRLDDPNELLFAVSKAVGEHLRVRRCLFNEIDVDNDIEIVHRDYCRDVESVAGVHKISDYSSVTSKEMEAGKTVVNHDSKTDPRTAPDYERAYVQYGERAYVTVPLMRENRWVASLWVSDDKPRTWSKEEVSLLETIAERTWLAVEKLRITEALRASEALYRTIARNIPGGGIYVVDKNMRYIVADGAITEAFGLSREMLEGHTVSEVFHDQQRARMFDRLNRNLAGETVSYETEHNGRAYWTQQAPLHDSLGQAIIVTLDITERKRAEEALRQSEARFVQFMEHLPGLAWIKDEQGRYVYANAAAEKAFNAKREELYGKTDQEIFPSEIAAQFIKNDKQALIDGTGVQVIETLEQDDGVLHYSLVNKFPIPGSDGNIALIGGTAFDITERLRAEEALRRNEKMFSTLVDAAPFGVYFIDSEFRLRAINKGSEAVFSGIQPLIGRDFAEILRILWQEPFATEAIERFRHTLLTGESFISPTIIEERANIEEIQAYDWQIHRITLSDGTFGVVCYFYDLSEQKQMEAAVRASVDRYRNLFDLVPVAVYSCDANGLIQEYNHRAVELWGREPARNDPNEKYCGSFKIYYTDGRFMPHENCPMARILKEETLDPQELEIVVERSDGVRRTVIAHPLPIRNLRGEIVEAINCLYDITERKQAEESLQLLNLQLESRVAIRTAELQDANMALRESRKRLQILSQRLVEVQEEERRAIARELHDRVGQTLSALNINLIIMRGQILPDSLERVGPRFNDSMQLVGETITLVRDVMSNLRPAVLDDYGLEAALQSHMDEFTARYGIRVIFDRPTQPIPRLGPSIEMTFLRIAQEALINIARHANATQVTLSLWQDGSSVCMTILDNGSGIVSWQEANRPGSHGLTIMRERAEAFGGNLKVDSVPGQGTKVEMSIPIGKGSQNEVQKEIRE